MKLNNFLNAFIQVLLNIVFQYLLMIILSLIDSGGIIAVVSWIMAIVLYILSGMLLIKMTENYRFIKSVFWYIFIQFVIVLIGIGVNIVNSDWFFIYSYVGGIIKYFYIQDVKSNMLYIIIELISSFLIALMFNLSYIYKYFTKKIFHEKSKQQK